MGIISYLKRKYEKYSKRIKFHLKNLILGKFDEYSVERQSYNFSNFVGYNPYFPNRETLRRNPRLMKLYTYLYRCFIPFIFFGNFLFLVLRTLSLPFDLAADFIIEKILHPLQYQAVNNNNPWYRRGARVLVAITFIPLIFSYAVRVFLFIPIMIINPELAYREASATHPLLGKLVFVGIIVLLVGVALMPYVGIPIFAALVFGLTTTRAILMAIDAQWLLPSSMLFDTIVFVYGRVCDWLFPERQTDDISQAEMEKAIAPDQSAPSVAQNASVSPAPKPLKMRYVIPDYSEVYKKDDEDPEQYVTTSTFTGVKVIFSEVRAKHFDADYTKVDYKNKLTFTENSVNFNGLTSNELEQTLRKYQDLDKKYEDVKATQAQIYEKQQLAKKSNKTSAEHDRYRQLQEIKKVGPRQEFAIEFIKRSIYIFKILLKIKRTNQDDTVPISQHLKAHLEELAYCSNILNSLRDDNNTSYKQFRNELVTRLHNNSLSPVSKALGSHKSASELNEEDFPTLTSGYQANRYNSFEKFKNYNPGNSERIVDIAVVDGPKVKKDEKQRPRSEVIHLSPREIDGTKIIASDHHPLKTSFTIEDNQHNQDFSSLTWNVGMFPANFENGKDMALNEQRIKLVAQIILEQDTDAVCLQELFAPVIAEQLAGLLAEKYQCIRPTVTFNQTSGNLIFVKKDLEVLDKHHFSFNFARDCRTFSEETLVNKGVLGVKVKCRGNSNQFVTVTGFHFIGGGGKIGAADECSEARRDRMIGSLLSYKNDFAQQAVKDANDNNCTNAAVIINGDTNLYHNSKQELCGFQHSKTVNKQPIFTKLGYQQHLFWEIPDDANTQPKLSDVEAELSDSILAAGA